MVGCHHPTVDHITLQTTMTTDDDDRRTQHCNIIATVSRPTVGYVYFIYARNRTLASSQGNGLQFDSNNCKMYIYGNVFCRYCGENKKAELTIRQGCDCSACFKAPNYWCISYRLRYIDG